MIRRVWQLIAPAVWAPLLVFVVHVVLDRGLGIYGARPWVDIPMHFAGGLAVAYVMSTAAKRIHLSVDDRWAHLMPGAVFTVTGTATVAVLWEFAEFGLDRTLGTNLQVSLSNTMQDLAMGLLGAVALALVVAFRDADRRQAAEERSLK